MSNAVDKEVEIDDSEKTEKQDKGETEEQDKGETEEQDKGETEEQDKGETEEQEEEGDETLEQEDDGETLEQEDDGETLEREEDGDEQEDDGEQEYGEDEEQEEDDQDNEHLLKNCLMATIRIPIRIDKDGSFDMINHYGEIKIEEMSDIPKKSSDSLYTKLLAYIRENPEYLAKIMKDMEFKDEDEQQEQESVTEITPDLFDFSNKKTREKPLNTSFRSKTIKSKNFTKKNYKSDDKE
jgi:hypothetical protein